jgi:hypothetical protein
VPAFSAILDFLPKLGFEGRLEEDSEALGVHLHVHENGEPRLTLEGFSVRAGVVLVDMKSGPTAVAEDDLMEMLEVEQGSNIISQPTVDKVRDQLVTYLEAWFDKYRIQ